MPIELGPYDLLAPTGRGAMATVWRGVHRRQGVPVAVKVLHAESARNAEFRALFANEVRVMAGLDHPHIARVYDYGELPSTIADQTEGLLQAGCPFLVMEWASGGGLRLGKDMTSWSSLRSMLRSLLDALAHAHARDVVHRDLKPANVMLCTADDLRPGIKLADFGIAHLLSGDPQQGEGTFFGTPRFMAPEQVVGELRDLGPWTDLYALGCMAFAAATGSVPFRGESLGELMAAHLDAPVPQLQPRFEVPDGFESWVQRLLAKDPNGRFRRAADAMYALSTLDFTTSRRRNELGAEEEPDVGGTLTVLDLDEDRVPTTMWSQRSTSSSNPPAAREEGAPPIPFTWRGGDPLPRSGHIAGVGLGLYGMRQIPLVGRQHERDELWLSLREVAESGAPQLVALRGATGTGKSRLAEWLCQRAHELGAGTPIRVMHGPTQGPSQGLASALARHYRVGGLPRREVMKLLSQRLSTRDMVGHRRADALAQLVTGETEGDASVVFANQTERFSLLRSVLEELASSRPLVVSIDDATFGGESLAFVQHALEAWDIEPTRVLFVLAGAPDHEVVPKAKVLEVAPLGAAGHLRLVQELLGLEGELASKIASRTAGNPSFAVQLVQDWIGRGLLVPGDDGFRLEDALPALPEHVDDVWELRAARVRELASDEEMAALEIAAALGQHVDAAEWNDACTVLGLVVPRRLLDVLLAEQLMRTETRGLTYQFTHEPLRAAVERHARAERRFLSRERACAEMLRARKGPDFALRRGRHHHSAGEHVEALDALIGAARAYHVQGDVSVVLGVIDEYDRTLAAANLPADDERRVAGRALRVLTLAREGRFTDAEPLAMALVEESKAHGWVRTQLAMMARLVQLVRNRGDFAGAEAIAIEAEQLATAAGERGLRGDALMTHADIHNRAGTNERAEELFALAFQDFEALGREFDMARCETGLGGAARGLGHTDESIRYLSSARQRFDRVGSRWGVAKASNALADPLRDRGDFAEAERMYRESLAHLEALGAQEARFVEANLAILALQQKNTDVARTMLTRCEAALRRRGGESALFIAIELGFLATSALDGQWGEFDRSLARAREQLASGHYVDPDLALLLTMAADAAREGGEPSRARDCYALAAAEWRKLGRESDAAKLET